MFSSRFPVPFASRSTTLQGADPFAELHREMNRLFDDFVSGRGAPQGGAMVTAPRIDVKESQQELCVCADLPGVDPADVDVRLDGDMLTIRGERKSESEQKQEDFHLMERSWGTFQRSLQLPFAPNADQVKADYKHGVLTIHIPKQGQQERSRRIEIQAGGGQEGQAVQPSTGGGGGGPGGLPH